MTPLAFALYVVSIGLCGAFLVSLVVGVWTLVERLRRPCLHSWETKADQVIPCSQTHIYILACRWCGKINKTITRVFFEQGAS